MGTRPTDESEGGERVTLKIDDRGRLTIPKRIRDRLGIEPDDEVPAEVVGSVLEIDPRPSSELETVAAGRDDWADSTPTDAGEALFGPMAPDAAGGGRGTRSDDE